MIYVGQSVNLFRRWLEWRSAFASGLGVKSLGMKEAIGQTDPDKWVFKVVGLYPVEKLDGAEQETIRALQGKGLILLNRLLAKERKPTGAIGDRALTELVGPDGNPISYHAAATLLGVSWETVRKKLKKLRREGITRVKISSGKNPAYIY